MKLNDIDIDAVAKSDPSLAVALRRRAEAERQVLNLERRRAAQTGEGTADRLAESIMKGLKAVAGIKIEEPSVDLEGTKAPFSDRRGSLAKDAVAAKRGGIGVVDSNTDPDAPDMSHGQGPGHDHPDLRGPTEEESELARRVMANEVRDPDAEKENSQQRRGSGRSRGKDGD